MTAARKFVCSLLLLALPLLQGCNKKKAGLPPKMQAPTIAVALPDQIPENQTIEEPAPHVPQPQTAQATTKSKPKKPARTSAKKTSPPANAAPPPPAQQPAANGETVAGLRPPRNPASEVAPDTVIAAAIPSAQMTQKKEDTARMMETTENALKGITRQLNDDEKAMRSQIQSYLQQSRKATTDGDYERAYNLAKKAQLLADALIKK